MHRFSYSTEFDVLLLYGMIFAFFILSNTPPQASLVPLSSENPVPYIFDISYCRSKSNCVMRKYSKPGNTRGLSACPTCKPCFDSIVCHVLILSLMNLRISGGFAAGPVPRRPNNEQRIGHFVSHFDGSCSSATLYPPPFSVFSLRDK